MKKDNKSGGVLNTDKDALLRYKREKLVEKKITQLQNHIAELKNSLIGMDKRLDKLEQR